MTTQASVVMDRITGTATYEHGQPRVRFDPLGRAERIILNPMESVVIGTSARLADIRIVDNAAIYSYVEPMLNPPTYSVVDLMAYRTLEQRAPQFLPRHFGRDMIELLSLVLQHGHKPVLSLDDEETLEMEVRLNTTEILLLSVTSAGMTDALVHNAQRGSKSIASSDIAGVVRFLRESRKVSQVKAK
ncbi:MAG: hypothetical protein Q7K03_06710 [Dehalococcoidia bacterium]|nr:hypothetical protein [Dehalococcoidia bacterium]